MRRTVSRVALFALALLLAALPLAGCAAASPFREGASKSAAPAAAPADSGAQLFDTSLAQAGGAAQEGAPTNALLNRKMVARANLAMQVADTNAALQSIDEILADVGGFIAAENLYNQSSGDSTVLAGSLTLRVPVETLEETMARLEALAVFVASRTINREDVTDQYTDLDARLRNLQATEEELRAMLQETRERPDATPEDVLAVHNRLMEIRGQIEQVQGQKNMLDNLIGLSTIEVQLSPDAASLPVVETGWRPGAVLRDATRALVNGLQAVGTFLIWFVVAALPILLLALLPFIVLFFIIRALVRRRNRRAAAAPPA